LEGSLSDDKAQILAERIAFKASDLLRPLQREMDRNGWAPEFRKIMWQAVADTASTYAAEQG
jgi:hypothetical protein